MDPIGTVIGVLNAVYCISWRVLSEVIREINTRAWNHVVKCLISSWGLYYNIETEGTESRMQVNAMILTTHSVQKRPVL